MPGISEEALRKLKKDELIAIIQKQDVKNKRPDKHMKSLVAEVRKLTSRFAKLKCVLAISENITTVLSERLVQMKRQCWSNDQNSRRECVEIVGIPSSAHHSQLGKSLTN